MGCKCSCGCHRPYKQAFYELAVLEHGIAYKDASVELRKANPDGTRTLYWTGTIQDLCELLKCEDSL